MTSPLHAVRRRRRLALLIIGAIVTGAHHVRQTSAAGASAALLSSLSDAARALVVFPVTVRVEPNTKRVQLRTCATLCLHLRLCAGNLCMRSGLPP